MLVDLAEQTETRRSIEADVLIVGAGIAGLVLATRLRKMKVVVLESGAREQAAEIHPLNRVVQLGDKYCGASEGRFRCLGGTSTRWGGALIPFIDHDLSPRPYIGLQGFPIELKEIRPYLAKVEELFGLDGGAYDEEFVHQISARKHIPIGDPDFKARFAKWPTFKNRNVAVLFSELIERDPSLEVWINSTVTSFDLNRENGRLRSVVGRSENQKSVAVSAKHFVMCAGAIESTRLLLLLDREHGGRVFHGCEALGRFFYDHISAPLAEIRAKQVSKLNRMAGFRFRGSTMRSLRYELSVAAQERERVGSAFGHISFKTEKITGFDILRQFFRSQQRSGRIDPSILMDALCEAPYLAKLGFWRIFYNQLLWPIPASYELHVVAEQMPRADNYIALSTERDVFGQPLASIRWRVSPEDWNTFSAYKRYFDRFWDRQGLRNIGELEWRYGADCGETEELSHADVYHPGGTTRMGSDPRSAVVDSDLRVFEVSNLWIASTSVFPSGGGENPTLMLILFTLRLADHLEGKLNVC